MQSIVWQALRKSTDAKVIGESIQARLSALSRSHDLLTRKKKWASAGLRDIVMDALEPFGASRALAERLIVRGVLPIVRELAANADRTGAQVVAAAAALGCGPTHLYALVRRYSADRRLTSLLPQRPGPNRGYSRLTAQMEVGSLEATWPLALSQIDHTLVDVFVVDSVTRMPIQRPWLTLAIIERLIGTMMGKVHLLPGTTFSDVRAKGDLDPEKSAAMTLDEVERWLSHAIAGVYHRDKHRALDRPPMAAWESGIVGDDGTPGCGEPAASGALDELEPRAGASRAKWGCCWQTPSNMHFCASSLDRCTQSRESAKIRYGYSVWTLRSQAGVQSTMNSSIEHVLPQTVDEGSEWAMMFPTEETRNEWTHRLANLVFLTHRINTRASNWSFERKKKEYFGSGDGSSPFVITQGVLQTDQWTPAHLQARQRQLLLKLCQVWQTE